MLSMVSPYSLQCFERQFGDYLRSQNQSEKHIPSRVGGVYRALVFNNVMGFLNQCFPICKSILKDDWQLLGRYFFQCYPSHSPYFSEIPMYFVDFLSKLPDKTKQSDWHPPIDMTYEKIVNMVPDYMAELAHYEWLELFVDTVPECTPKMVVKGKYLNPTVQNFHYRYAVQEIDADGNAPLQDTFLAVLRANDAVCFVQLNGLTHWLLEYIKQSTTAFDSQQELLTQFAQSIEYPDGQALVAFGDELFAMLCEQSIFLDHQNA